MSLAENLLNSLDDYETNEVVIVEEEPHIIVGSNRVITVPEKLKLIAVKGDKDIETVTIDCVRYWDGHDLSAFAVYINYILPNGDEGTYIPKSITRLDDIFTFDWEIGSEITYAQGKLTFWIVAKLTNTNADLIKQWSSLQNSECSIAQGGDKIYVPEKQTDQDVISQAIAVSKEAADKAQKVADKLDYSIVQTTGTSKDKVMSQKTVGEHFANAFKGKVSGAIVSMDDVSPLEHKIPVRLESENLIPYPYSSTSVIMNGVTFTVNSDSSVTLNGTSTASAYLIINTGTLKLSAGQYVVSGYTNDIEIAARKNNTVWLNNNAGTFNEGDTFTNISIYVSAGKTFDNVTVYPKLQKGTKATPWIPFVPNDTAVTVKGCGKNHLPNDIYDFNNWIVKSGLQKIYPFNNLAIGQTYTFSFKVLQNLANFGYFYLTKKKGETMENIARFATGGAIERTSHSFVVEEGAEYYLYGWFQYADSGAFEAIANIQLELSPTATPYEPYIEGETITTTLAEGAELTSIAPNMTITTDKSGVVIDTEYNKDSNIVIEKLTQAIISMGGIV